MKTYEPTATATILGKLGNNPQYIPKINQAHFELIVDTATETMTFTVIAGANMADTVMEYLVKGHSVMVEGELHDDNSVEAKYINFISSNLINA